MSGRRRSATLAMLFGYASLLISLARNILFVPIYLHNIPLAEYGAWLATGGALALILINDFGLSGVVIQKISVNFGAGDFEALGSLAGSALAIGSLMALLLSALSLACVPYLPGLQSLNPLQKHAVVNCFLIAVAANTSRVGRDYHDERDTQLADGGCGGIHRLGGRRCECDRYASGSSIRQRSLRHRRRHVGAFRHHGRSPAGSAWRSFALEASR